MRVVRAESFFQCPVHAGVAFAPCRAAALVHSPRCLARLSPASSSREFCGFCNDFNRHSGERAPAAAGFGDTGLPSTVQVALSPLQKTKSPVLAAPLLPFRAWRSAYT